MTVDSQDSRRHKRILLIVSSYAPNLGGLQTVTAALAQSLRQRGYETRVLTQRSPRTLAAHETLDGVPVERWPFLPPNPADTRRGRIDLFASSLLLFGPTVGRLAWQIYRFKPDVVNVHFAGAPSLFVLGARRLVPFRLVVSLHGDDVEGAARRTTFERETFRRLVRTADAVTACSDFLLCEAIALEPGIGKKGKAIHNGMELPPLPENVTQVNTILAGGRMVPKKGLDVLLRAFAQLARPEWTLELTGDGPERASLETLTRKLGIETRVRFLGTLTRNELFEHMAASRFVTVPSRQEPFGLGALEAMALGKPVIASRVGGLPEVLEGADACLVPPDAPDALARAMHELAVRLESDPAYGQRNRECAAQFSIERMTDDYMRAYG